MNKKKGFTLIETLIVIAILGVVLTIVTPALFNLLQSSKEAVFGDSVKSIISMAENKLSDDALGGNSNYPEKGRYVAMNINTINFENKNLSEYTGYVYVFNIGTDKDVYEYYAMMTNNKYMICGFRTDKISNLTIKEINSANPLCAFKTTENIYVNSNTGQFVDSGTFYIENSKKETVTTYSTPNSTTNKYYTFTASKTGNYKIELWGAGGGKGKNNGVYSTTPGKGGYTSGIINLNSGDKLYIYVGAKGADATDTALGAGGYNGGGNGVSNTNKNSTGGGGGATDVRITAGDYSDITSLKSRIMVAGGGAGSTALENGGDAGGIESFDTATSQRATQILGYQFGIGAPGVSNTNVPSSGAGGGYFGGKSRQDNTASKSQSATGGSSFVSGYELCNAINSDGTSSFTPNHFSGKKFNEPIIKSGKDGFSSPDDTKIIIGNADNGYAKITSLF